MNILSFPFILAHSMEMCVLGSFFMTNCLLDNRMTNIENIFFMLPTYALLGWTEITHFFFIFKAFYCEKGIQN